jgi:hypothetical protein
MARGDEETHGGLTETEMRDNVLRLVFGGDESRFEEFLTVLRHAVPTDAAAVLRGSAITNRRYENGAPFDAKGPGTSDLDLTIVGGDILHWYSDEGFYIPGAHTKPLSERDPDIAPALVPLRDKLSAMVGRPVNIQGTRDWVMFVRDVLMGQPYLTLIGRVESP